MLTGPRFVPAVPFSFRKVAGEARWTVTVDSRFIGEVSRPGDRWLAHKGGEVVGDRYSSRESAAAYLRSLI